VINEDGRAVGVAFLPGDTVFHATLWKHVGEMTDLGTLGNDPCSYATGINAVGQVVGNSTDCKSNFRAFLWEDGSILDLNALIPPGSALHLGNLYTINDHGEIAGEGDDSSGNGHAFLLIPCDENHSGLEGCDYSLVDPSATPEGPAPYVPRTLSPRPRRTNWRHVPGLAGATIGPAIENSAAKSSSWNNGDDMTNDLLDPSETRGTGAFCSVGGGVLTGWCSAPQSLHCVAKKVPAQCPVGKKAISPVPFRCGVIGQHGVHDVSRPCSNH
jgi:probable HAF family extracellular repeat protein